MPAEVSFSYRKMLVDGALELATQDAPLAAETLARGLRKQTRGAKLSAVRMLVASLADGERPGFFSAAVMELTMRPQMVPAAETVSDSRAPYQRRRMA